ncbi:hypothetical protein HHI36_002362, partial [Cryptolaemus montrouzieri]
MVKNMTKSWVHPADETVFRQFIGDKMENMLAPTDINELNDKIVNTIRQANNKFCPKNEKEQRMSPETKKKMEERRIKASDVNTEPHEMKAINKEISKAIRKDIRQYKNKQILRIIEENE